MEEIAAPALWKTLSLGAGPGKVIDEVSHDHRIAGVDTGRAWSRAGRADRPTGREARGQDTGSAAEFAKSTQYIRRYAGTDLLWGSPVAPRSPAPCHTGGRHEGFIDSPSALLLSARQRAVLGGSPTTRPGRERSWTVHRHLVLGGGPAPVRARRGHAPLLWLRPPRCLRGGGPGPTRAVAWPTGARP